MATVQIIEVRTIPSPAAGRAGQKATLVIYRLDNAGPRSVIIEADAPSDSQVQAAIKDDAARQGRLTSTTFTL